MKLHMLAALLPIFLFVSVPTFAQTVDKPAVPAVDQPATTAPEVAAPVVVPDVVKVEGDKVTVNDIVTNASEVASAIKQFKDAKTAGDKTAIRLGFMLMLAAIFKILLSLVKFTGEFWKGNKGKMALRISTLVLGIAVFFTARMGAGESIIDAGLLALSGPLAISFHELFDIVVQLVQKKPAAAAPAAGAGG